MRTSIIKYCTLILPFLKISKGWFVKLSIIFLTTAFVISHYHISDIFCFPEHSQRLVWRSLTAWIWGRICAMTSPRCNWQIHWKKCQFLNESCVFFLLGKSQKVACQNLLKTDAKSKKQVTTSHWNVSNVTAVRYCDWRLDKYTCPVGDHLSHSY